MFGLTPMHITCMRGNLEVAKILDGRGASLTTEDKDGKSPPEVAEDNEHTDMMNYTRARHYFDRTAVSQLINFIFGM